jgi:hypothetical protein
VPYGNIIPDDRLGPFIGAMQYSSILNIDLIANPDLVHVSTNDGIEPNAAIISHYSISDNRRIGSQKTIEAETRRYAFYR